MAFSDPQSVTINAVATSLPRVSVGANSSLYSSADGLTKLTISHQIGKRFRRTVRIDSTKVAADPFNSSLNASYSMSTYIVVDIPKVGYTVTEQKYLVDALTAYLTASSGAKVTQLLGGEN